MNRSLGHTGMSRCRPGFLTALFLLTPGLHGADAAALRLVPFPKEVQIARDRFALRRQLVFQVTGTNATAWGRLLNEELALAGLPAVRVRPVDGAGPSLFFRLAGRTEIALPAIPARTEPGSYALEVRPRGVTCVAGDPAGLCYGFQTLRQLIRANRQDHTIPCLGVRDWPSLRWRGFQDDLTRGPSSTLDTLRFEASLGAYLKLNLMTYYMESQFAFRGHPTIGPTNGSLTAPELTALVAHARPLQLEILGNQQSFGHFGRILSQPRYARLRETPEVLSPAREETYQLLDDLYGEVCPLLPFPWFNVCCDETEGLGSGPSRELARQIGVGGVYVRHLRRLHDLLADKYGKRMMMWGDIILQHPDHLGELPRDTIMLSWGYDARPSFEAQILPFARSGYEFFVCPGVSDWNRVLPDFGVAVTNIQNFVRDGVQHGALGMINTDWEDDGEALKAVKWHADAWAAECAWNGSVTPIEAFNRRVGAVLFGEREDHFGQAIAWLAHAHRQPAMEGMVNRRFWQDDFVSPAPADAESAARDLLAVVRPALEHLEICRHEARTNGHILDVFIFGARRMEAIALRLLDGVESARLYTRISAGAVDAGPLSDIELRVRRNRDRLQNLGREFADLWHAESKPYALDWTEQRYANAIAGYDRLLERLAAARAALAAGRPLPSAREIGLERPPPGSR